MSSSWEYEKRTDWKERRNKDMKLIVFLFNSKVTQGPKNLLQNWGERGVSEKGGSILFPSIIFNSHLQMNVGSRKLDSQMLMWRKGKTTRIRGKER